MPKLSVTTSASPGEEALAALVAALSRATSEGLGKDEKWVTVAVNTNVAVSFGGTMEPAAAQVSLMSLGSESLNPEATATLAASYCAALQEHAGVPPERVMIEFTPIDDRHLVGLNGKTFA